MQVRSLPRELIRAGVVASRLLDGPSRGEVAAREDAVGRWRRAMADGLSAEAAAAAVGVSRATLYRWEHRPDHRSRRPRRVRPRTWTPSLVEAVQRLRDDFPMWGRAKLGPLLRAEGHAVSDATVGRVIGSLVARGRVTPVPTLRRRHSVHRRSARRRHATRLPKGLRPDRPGALVQVDTLSVNVAPDRHVKHFTAYDPVAKWTVGRAFRRATAAAATLFLDKLLADMPFPVHAIQVDGGSEFRAEFEDACQHKGITLYELPPKRPQLNGAVERCNSTWRYEFYSTYDLEPSVEAINPILDSFQHLYNHHRPHGALAGQTPKQHLDLLRAQGLAPPPIPSHMS